MSDLILESGAQALRDSVFPTSNYWYKALFSITSVNNLWILEVKTACYWAEIAFWADLWAINNLICWGRAPITKAPFKKITKYKADIFWLSVALRALRSFLLVLPSWLESSLSRHHPQLTSGTTIPSFSTLPTRLAVSFKSGSASCDLKLIHQKYQYYPYFPLFWNSETSEI